MFLSKASLVQPVSQKEIKGLYFFNTCIFIYISMCPLSEDMGCKVGFGRCHSTRVQSCRMVSGGTGGNPYYDNHLVNYGHLMYSLNFHQAKQGAPHQRTLSD